MSGLEKLHKQTSWNSKFRPRFNERKPLSYEINFAA